MPIFTAGTGNASIDLGFSSIAALLIDVTQFGVARPGPTSQQAEVYSPLTDFVYRLNGTGFSGFDALGLPGSGTVTGFSQVDLSDGLSYFTASGFSIAAASLRTIIESRNADALINFFFGGDDTITGSGGAGAQQDVLMGYGGNDIIMPREGPDIIDGGDGDDTVIYRETVGTSSISGGAGSDTLHIEVAPGEIVPPGLFRVFDFRTSEVSGFETFRFGGTQAQAMVFNTFQLGTAVPLNATLRGTAGHQDLMMFVARFTPQSNVIGGTYSIENANFTLLDWEPIDRVVLTIDRGTFPTTLPFTLIGSRLPDAIIGSGGPELLRGGQGGDFMQGFDGNDTFEVRTGDLVTGDSMDGGAGLDTLRTMGANVDYRVGTFTSIERIQFAQTAGEATMNAMINASQIGTGLSATLVVSGSAAQDSVQIFAASGGTVNTSGWTFDFPAWNLEDYIVYVGDNGNETFVGFPGLDIYFGSPGNDTYDGGGAFDFAAYIFSPNAVTADLAIAGAQVIGGNQGSDTFLNLEGLAGSQLGDNLFGDAQSNIVLSLGGDDLINGRGGSDDLRGGDGNDRIEGGAGTDTLLGEAGADRFVYRTAAEGGDTISDFVSGADKIEVSAAGFSGGLTAGGNVTLISGVNPIAVGGAGVFLYNTTTGVLAWDADGAGIGAAVTLATLTGHPAIVAADIVVTSIAAASLEGGVVAEETPTAEVGPLDHFNFDDSCPPQMAEVCSFGDGGMGDGGAMDFVSPLGWFAAGDALFGVDARETLETEFESHLALNGLFGSSHFALA